MKIFFFFLFLMQNFEKTNVVQLLQPWINSRYFNSKLQYLQPNINSTIQVTWTQLWALFILISCARTTRRAAVRRTCSSPSSRTTGVPGTPRTGDPSSSGPASMTCSSNPWLHHYAISHQHWDKNSSENSKIHFGRALWSLQKLHELQFLLH